MIIKILTTALNNYFFGWKQPRHLIFHITNSCNSRCGMCFAWKRLNKENILTFWEIEKIAQSLKDLIFLDISGGEPFLRNDLDKILAIFAKYSPNAYINLPTNGLLPGRIFTMTQKILNTCPLTLSLNLSLDGFEETHDSIRGVKGSFKKTMKTYKKLVDLKKKNSRLSLKISTVILNKNFKELIDFSEFVKKDMPEIDFHTLILMRGNPPKNDFALPSVNTLKKEKGNFLKIWQKYNYGKNLGKFGDKIANISHKFFLNSYIQTLEQKQMAILCLAGSAHAVIYANGDLAFCELRNPIGNLRMENFDFNKLWFSSKARQERKSINKNVCYCTNGCNWTDNIFFNPLIYPKLIKEFLSNI